MYSIIFIIGLVMIIWQIDIYRVTDIDIWIPITIILVVAGISFAIDFRNYVRTFTVSGIYLYIYSTVFYIVGCGFIACSIFMISNYHLADGYTSSKSYEILDKSSLPGRRRHRAKKQLLVKIKYENEIKEMVFNNYHYIRRDKFKTVELDIRNGLFGFDVFYGTELK